MEILSMALDSGFVIAISLVGISIIVALMIIVNKLVGKAKDREKNHQNTK
jgi:galactitol-specific phosphotransferase system IIC component